MASNFLIDLRVRSAAPFDLIYLDADKRRYSEYLELILAGGLLGERGLLVADNTLCRGGVVPGYGAQPPADAHGDEDGFSAAGLAKRAEALAAFNQLAASDGRLHTVMLPICDGVTLIRRRRQ